MNINEFDNKILIINDYEKKSILKRINKLVNIKLITLTELKKKYIYDYDYKSILYVSKKYNYIPSIAKKYIENTYFINDEYSSEKINFLREIKNDLISNNLLIEDKMFKSFLHDKDIVLYNLKYIDFYEASNSNLGNNILMDGIHFNPKGQDILFNKAKEVFILI